MLASAFLCHTDRFMQTTSDSKITISHLFPPIVHPPSLVQCPSRAGGFSQGRCGCAPCQNGAGPEMPLCPGTPFVFPPPGVTPSLPAVAYAVRGHPEVPRIDSTPGLPNLKSSGER